MQKSAEKSIFLNALDIEAIDEREAYLESVCGDDAALRGSVDALLSAHQQTLNPLDQPIVEEGAISLDQLDPTAVAEHGKTSDDIGMTIGPYRLMELIGEGGFGLVYGAQQERPVRRRVALKIIKPGTGSSEVLARFDAERQAIAMMDHPNIAQVFDAGVTQDARPYFVMELVRGVPITEFCQRSGLSLPKKLELFADVCAAVHHAHQKGVIHRDLKPSNVLVTLHDTRAVAKVIDFGVAKAMGQSLTDQTIYTRLYSMIGTPLYMSPEQASMSALDVDTRSDIYSLGVMLYELLTGTTPFDRKRLDTAGYDEMRRIIQEEEPPKPSVRLTTVDKKRGVTLLSDQPTRAVPKAGADARSKKNRETIPSDLDWIVMKAMEKDRARRYESAAEMAADLRRFLAQEPIEARPPSKVYQLTKFARRNRVAIATGSLVALALVIGSAASLYQASQALKAKDEAISSKEEAEAARQEVQDFADDLKAANVLIGSARTYEDTQRWDAAFTAYNEAVKLVPNYYLVWVQRGKLLVDMKLWEEAAEDYAAAVELGAPMDGPQWTGVPALLAYTDHKEDLDAMRSMLLKPQQENPEATSWSMIRAAVASPSTDIDYEQLASRAEQLLLVPQKRRGGPGGPGGMGPGKDFFSEMLRGTRPGEDRQGPLREPRMDGPGAFGEPGAIGFGKRPRDGAGPNGPGAKMRGPNGRGANGNPRQSMGPNAMEPGADRFGGPESRGPEFGGPEFGGPAFGGPEFGGPEFGGPEFGGRESGGPEFGGREFGGRGGGGFGGPGRQGPGPGRGGPGRDGGRGGPRDQTPEQFLPMNIKHYLTGWVQLRAGNHDRAIEHLEIAGRDPGWGNADVVHSLVAMAHFHAGRKAQATEALRLADEAIDREMERLDASPNSLKHWFDFVEMLLSHREASVLITGSSPRVDARMIAVQQDARAMLLGESQR